MIKKLLEKWKQEWWIKNQAILLSQFEEKRVTLIYTQDEEISRISLKGKAEKELLLIKIRNEEEELNYRLRLIEERKKEALKADNDLKDLIKTLEAKASPSAVWAEAFTTGFSKSWDMMLPMMTSGFEKLKKSIEDKAIEETLGRMHGNNKKNH